MKNSALLTSYLLLNVFVFTGCGPSATIVRPDFKQSDTLMIGKLQEKTVGEPMVTKMNLYYYPGFIAEIEYLPPSYMSVQLPKIFANSEWYCDKKHINGDSLCKPTTGWSGNVSTATGSHPATHYNLVIDPSGIPIGYEINTYNTVNRFGVGQPKVFKPIAEIAMAGSFKQELTYNGKSKDTIKITYREFKDNFARPAYYQDLNYDLAESKNIGFRGMLIEIVEATNSTVKFIVKNPMTN